MENRRKIEPKKIPSRLLPRLLVVFTRQLEILVTTLIEGVRLKRCPLNTGFTVYVFAEKAVLWILALQMSSKNCNRLESPLSVWTNPVYKTSSASLPAKQAITVDSSSSVLNTNLLHDWSNFDLSKLYMPVEHISLMPLSCFCL